MRIHISILTILVIFLASCQAPETELDKLISERDSLRGLVDEHNDRITQINKQVAESDENFESSLTLVATLTTTTQPFEHYFEIYGEVKTDKNVLLYPETMGLVTKILVSEGQKVSQGQVIAQLDNKIVQDQIREVQTLYEMANTAYEKQSRLWEQKIGSEMQYLQAKTQKESLESSISTLNSQLGKAQVRAPFSGVVDAIFPKQGEMGNPQMPIARVVNTEKMYIKSDVSEQHLQAVRQGSPVQLELPGLNKTLESTISEVSKYINPENRSFKIRVDLPVGDTDLRPNQMAHMKINDYGDEAAIVLPSSVIMQTPSGKDFVFVLDEKEGKTFAKRVLVKTGFEYEGKTEILEGLEKDTQVISEGAKSVRDGQRVRTS
jgi:membrane fusion protein, multidrug efflux system